MIVNWLKTLKSIKKISVFGQYYSSWAFSAFLKTCCSSMKEPPNVLIMALERSLIFWSMTTVKKRMMRLKMTENNISSFSLCSIHCFQMLNCKDAYFPDPWSPNEVMFWKILWLMLLMSDVSMEKKLWKVWLKFRAFESTEYWPSYTKFKTSTMTGCFNSLSMFISSMMSKESFLSVMWKIGSLIYLDN